MSVPASREQFKQYCLRRLGRPVIEINVDDDQVEDRIDEALKFYWDYHFDGTEQTWYSYQLSETDIQNQYIPLPPNIIGAVEIFPIGESLSTNNLFNIRYQISLNDLYDLTATTMVPYYLAMQHIQFLEQLLVGQQPVRYNRWTNKLHIDMDWGKVSPGNFIVVKAYQIVDPNVYTEAWGDRWLTRYATSLIKFQWGSNLIKYQDVNLPGGMKFNAMKIYDEAKAEIEELEHEMIHTYSLPIADQIG
jgi:hypothetical protein